jgi:NADH-quinone oxidoreductase subunit G
MDEPTPPADPDSPLSFSMEGYLGEPPSSIIPFFWSPGWNSEQSINKYQIEVSGALHDGDPGRRLIEPAVAGGAYDREIPEPWSRAAQWAALPIHHIFGTEETSARGDAIQERIPAPYFAIGKQDAGRMELKEGQKAQLEGAEWRRELTLKIMPDLPEGAVGLPYGLPGMEYFEAGDWIDIKKASS